VLDGIIAAGNLNARASRRNIILVRPSRPDDCRTVLAICYPEIVQIGDTTTNYQLRPGDRIYVPTAGLFEGLCHHHPCVTCNGPHRPCDQENCHAPASLELPAARSVEITPAPSTTNGISPAPSLR
jgi:hypothetical protein